MDYINSTILGILQGLTEFLPISSSGHLVLGHYFLDFSVENDLAFDAVLQLASVLAIIIVLRADIKKILKSIFSKSESSVLLLLIILSTIPAVIFGILLEDYMETVFRSPLIVAISLMVGSFIMWAAEIKSQNKKTESKNIESISIFNAILIGFFQCLALIPGMSRSGMTIAGGLYSNLSRKEAARYSFLIAVPIIGGSGTKKLLEIYSDGTLLNSQIELLTGFLGSLIVSIIAVKFLLMFLEKFSLRIFIFYRIVLATIIFGILIFSKF